MTKRMTTTEAAKRLGLCQQRIAHKLKSGHFPNAGKCECGRTTLIPESDVEANFNADKRRKTKDAERTK